MRLRYISDLVLIPLHSGSIDKQSKQKRFLQEKYTNCTKIMGDIFVVLVLFHICFSWFMLVQSTIIRPSDIYLEVKHNFHSAVKRVVIKCVTCCF